MTTKAERRKQNRKAQPASIGRIEKIAQETVAELEKKQEALVQRPVGRPKNQPAFVKVQRAKELLAKQSEMMVRLLGKAAKVAAAKGDSAPIEFALKHAASVDDQGKTVRPIESSIDKQEAGGSSAPTINIGWIGPAPERKQLPADVEVIDVTPKRIPS